MELTGKISEWTLGAKRKYSVVTLTYGQASELFASRLYNGNTGKGEQRQIKEPRIRLLSREMDSGNYTPATISVGLNKKQRESILINDGVFTINVEPTDKLCLVDGGHRLETLSRKARDLKATMANATEEQKAELEQKLREVLSQPITATIHLDGDAQNDFINLQSTMKADASHLTSLKIQNKIFSAPEYKLAFDVAKLLNKNEDSPFNGQIRFDSRGISPLPLSTLCASGSSDIGTSLVGLAKVGLANGAKKDPALLAMAVMNVHKVLSELAPEVLESGKVLTTIANGGGKGSATMMIGLGSCLAHKCRILNQEQPSEQVIKELVAAAKKTLDAPINGNFSGPVKRNYLRVFAESFFETDTVAKHAGIPVELMNTLSPSTFGASALPKPPKKVATIQKVTKMTKAQKQAAKDAEASLDFDEPVVFAGDDFGSASPEPWDNEVQA